MRWAPDAWRIPVASTEGVPAWPLPGLAPKFSATSFGYQRPFTCEDNCERWHCGMDLVDASHDQLVVATEDARIVSVNLGWTAGTRALAATTREHVLIYGGLVPGAGAATGSPRGRTYGEASRSATSSVRTGCCTSRSTPQTAVRQIAVGTSMTPHPRGS